MKKFLVVIVATFLLATGCTQTKSEEGTNKFTDNLEKSQDAFSEYKLGLQAICKTPIAVLTGKQFAQCKDIKDNEAFYELFFSEEDKDFSYLPAFCERKVSEMTAEELSDCLTSRPENNIE